MGATGEDVLLSPRARAWVPHNIEAKSRAAHAVYGYYDQADTHGSEEPLLIIKQNRRKPLAVVDAEWYFEMLHIAMATKRNLT